jgi:Zn-dependent peptidase ImmA (M78 family)
MIAREILESVDKKQQIQKFFVWACKKLGISSMPRISFTNDLADVEKNRTFGSTRSDGKIWVYMGNRNPADIMRTLAHELVHYKQFETNLATTDMDEQQRQSVEDVANAVAGRMLRTYGKNHAEIYSDKINTH